MNLNKILNDKKGVSILMLIIAVVMMAMIVSFAVYYSEDTTPEAKLASAYSSLKVIKDACDNAETLIELNPKEYDDYYFFGYSIKHNITSETELDEYAQNCGLESSLDFSDRTFMIKPAETDEEERILKNLELKGVSSIYVVDLDNKKYYIVGGTKRIDGGELYEYKDIVKAYEMLVK